MVERNDRAEVQLSIPTVLHRLLVEQKQELQSLRFPPGALDNGEKLFAWYRATGGFRWLCEQTVTGYLKSRTEEEVNGLHQHFVGGVYENMAYPWFASRQPSSRVLFSPKKTLELYQALYPDKIKVQHPFGMDSLKGISVPDGILVELRDGGERISAICEYTSTVIEPYFEQKYKGFHINKECFPEVFADAFIIFVVPKRTLLRKILGNIVKIPFTHKEFGSFINSIPGDSYLPEQDTARLRDYEERVREQLERIRKHQDKDNGKGLTLEERRYLWRT